jgi:hypothetical protein
MKHIVLAGLAALLMVGCNKEGDNSGGTADKTAKDSINQQKDAVDSNVKDAKKQMDANADAAKAQLDADKKKIDAATTSATATNK